MGVAHLIITDLVLKRSLPTRVLSGMPVPFPLFLFDIAIIFSTPVGTVLRLFLILFQITHFPKHARACFSETTVVGTDVAVLSRTRVRAKVLG